MADETTTVRRRSRRWLVYLGWLLPLVIVGLLLGALTVAGLLFAIEQGWIGRPAPPPPDADPENASEIAVDDEPNPAGQEDHATARSAGETAEGRSSGADPAGELVELQDTAEPKADEAAATPAPAQPTGPGSLSVKSFPWAEITVNGRSFGRTPVEVPELPPGSYTITASSPDIGWTGQQTITIRSGQTTDVQLAPTAQ